MTDQDRQRTVSVIVPTAGRYEVARAVESVLRQTAPPLEVLVVEDGPDRIAHQVRESLTRLGVEIVTLSRRTGAPAARNFGVKQARGDFVAFLDDDDWWVPIKLESQLAFIDSVPESLQQARVYSCRVTQVADGVESMPIPTIVKSDAKVPVFDFLFARRRASMGRASLFTSTLCVDRRLAQRIPWNEDLTRHQDWDWLGRLERAGALTVQQEAALVKIAMNSAGSISASSDWRASLRWVHEMAAMRLMSRRARVDFLAAQTLRYALSSRSPIGVLRTVWAICVVGLPPSRSAILISLAGAVPRRALMPLDRMFSRVHDFRNAKNSKATT